KGYTQLFSFFEREFILFVPGSIFDVIVGYPSDFTFQQFLRYRLYFTRRHTGINISCFTDHMLEDHGPCRNNTPGFHYSIIHNPASHAYEHQWMDCTTMDDGLMTYGHLVTYNGFGSFVC